MLTSRAALVALVGVLAVASVPAHATAFVLINLALLLAAGVDLSLAGPIAPDGSIAARYRKVHLFDVAARITLDSTERVRAFTDLHAQLQFVTAHHATGWMDDIAVAHISLRMKRALHQQRTAVGTMRKDGSLPGSCI